MNMMKLMLAAGTAAVLTGCLAVRQNDGGESLAHPFIAKDKIHEKYTVGKEKVTASDSVSSLFYFIRWGSEATHIADLADCNRATLVGYAKNGAYAIACDKAGCDAIAGAKYKVTSKNYFFIYQHATAELSGYPVNLTEVEVIPADKNTPILYNGRVYDGSQSGARIPGIAAPIVK